jgi:hypothetical protein
VRIHGRARVNTRWPQAIGVCDRCGAQYNHVDLSWQYQWVGPRIQNLRLLVCESCNDKPAEQLRTIILPPDPVPIMNPRPEMYVSDDNTMEQIGYSPAPVPQSVGWGVVGNIGSGAGVVSVFSGPLTKPAAQCVSLATSNSSYGNTIGKLWASGPGTAHLPAQILTDPVTELLYIVNQAVVYAPSDMTFLKNQSTSLQLVGSISGVSTVLASVNSVGVPGEIVTLTSTNATAFQEHSIQVMGDGVSPLAISYIQFMIAGPALYSDPDGNDG